MNPKRMALSAAGLLAGYAIYRAVAPKIPAGVVPVSNFDAERYLGKWFEVGRLDNRFERGLIKTTAEYTLNDDGSIHVVNSGFDALRGRHKQVSGTAVFVRGPNDGALKVSFFGPFYGGYNIIALDEDYRWAIIVGSSTDYFWVLSRDPELPINLRARATEMAEQVGIDPSRINWVQQ
ncbi:lipocalin family protein [Falsochrobactrum sp. TDYN1]|uniref:Outer membrane lipoprotein Blc n=1 Tax=Falsochrobactrum tianjinense TaxID=2706015 RepID=A0A949PNV0_9HYPH|nr:lipocalin family protein [Falsochrobactrum sp. TDYN1]MBV2144228.1 lipocalin family protein [Falsochrobactrum sp. TDYN1]